MTTKMPLQNEEKAIFALRALYASYGYTSFKMSKFEEYDLYVRNKNFLVSDHIITFTDTNGKLMALKPDVTLSIVKNSTDEALTTRQKVYYNENVYRVSDKSNTFREIMQVGLECIGYIDSYCLSEVLTLAVKSLEALSDDCVLEVSHLGIVSAAVDAIGASEEAKKKLYTCVREKNCHGVDAILSEEGIPSEKGELLKSILLCYGKPEKVFGKLAGYPLTEEMKQAANELETILKNIPSQNLRIDFSSSGDLRYYNGIVFKGFVNGIPTALLSGGQYDSLMKKMGRKSGAVGFAVYLDLLEDLNRTQEEYDIDTVILYDENSDSSLVASTAGALVNEGKSVLCEKAIPESKRFRALMKIEGSEVTLLEAHA